MPLSPFGYVPTEKEVLESLHPKFSNFEMILKNSMQLTINKETYDKHYDLIKDNFKISSSDIDGNNQTVYTLLKHNDENIGITV